MLLSASYETIFYLIHFEIGLFGLFLTRVIMARNRREKPFSFFTDTLDRIVRPGVITTAIFLQQR